MRLKRNDGCLAIRRDPGREDLGFVDRELVHAHDRNALAMVRQVYNRHVAGDYVLDKPNTRRDPGLA